MCFPDGFTWRGCVLKEVVGWFSWGGWGTGRRAYEPGIFECVLPASGQAGFRLGPWSQCCHQLPQCPGNFLPLSETQFPEREALVQCPWRSHPCQSSLGYWPGRGGHFPLGGQWSGAASSLLGAAEFGAWDELSAWLEAKAMSWSEGPLGILLGTCGGQGRGRWAGAEPCKFGQRISSAHCPPSTIRRQDRRAVASWWLLVNVAFLGAGASTSQSLLCAVSCVHSNFMR